MSTRATPPAPRKRRITLRDVLVVTVPVMVVAVWLFGSAVLDYHRIRQYDDWWSRTTSVRKFGWYRVRSLLTLPRATELEQAISPEDESVPGLRLVVDRREWNGLRADVPGRWGDWIEAAIDDGPAPHAVDVRFRGDGSAHWTSAKKSLTIKTKRDDLYRGFRRMAFSVKDVVPQAIVGTLAADFDVLAPETAVVPIWVNGRWYGVFRFVEPIDESFLRRRGLMPGNVFRGDTAERGEYFKDLPRELFRNPYIWDRVARNDRPGAIGDRALGEFLTDLNGASLADHERLSTWLDRGELSSLFALLLLAGDPYHMSGVHNQFWYEDPTAGTLHPIVWDLRLLELERPPPRSNLNRFWRSVLRDPEVMAGALERIAEQLQGGRWLARAERIATGIEERFGPHLELDRLRAGVVPPVGDGPGALAILRGNAERLGEWVSDARVELAVEVHDAQEPTAILDVRVAGRAPVELVGFESTGGARVGALRATAVVLAEGGLRRDLETAGRGDRARVLLAKPLRLLSGVTGEGPELVVEPLDYRLELAPWPVGTPGLRPILRNAITGEPVAPTERGDVGARIQAARSWHPWRRWKPTGTARKALIASLRTSAVPAPPPGKTRLAGDVELIADLVVPEGTVLTIEPGTTLRLAPDVSVLVRGGIAARGTLDRPIVWTSADPVLPWGTLALQGRGADGSRFDHVRFERGGGALLGRVEYKGMVSIHGASDVELRRCTFAANVRCDDALNVVGGDVDLLECHFHDTNADSIDYDLASGEIRDCLIERSGNDGLDLMTCAPRVLGTRILDSGDKGVSIGEASAPLLFDVEITGCATGVEVKDGSEPVILNSRVAGNAVGIREYAKNWRFGASGRAKLIGSLVAGNADDLVIEDGGRLTILASTIGTDPEGSPEMAPGDTTWARRLHGIGAEGARTGGVAGWWDERGLEVVERLRFRSGFGAPDVVWAAGAGVDRLDVRDADLVARVRGRSGRFGVRLAPRAEGTYRAGMLLVEVALEGIEECTLVVTSPDGDVRESFGPTGPQSVYRFVTVPLPARDFDGVVFDVRTTSGDGRVRLHSVERVERPGQGRR